MCGLCGIVRFDAPPESETLWRMTRTLAHRGPDDQGVAVSGPAGLGHTRLSILDLSAAGHQPMASADGAVTLVYNGEIYNFRELRRELEEDGVRHTGNGRTPRSCCAPTSRWGVAAFDRLHGMFAVAIWDARTSTLHLLRDHFGIKPLYYAALSGRDRVRVGDQGHPGIRADRARAELARLPRVSLLREHPRHGDVLRGDPQAGARSSPDPH